VDRTMPDSEIPWKEFEQAVAFLEETFAETAVVVTVNDHVPDLKGKLREVDVSIRIPYIDRDILVVIECRNRKRSSDITWIEQLVTKRQRLRIDRLIVVTNQALPVEVQEAADEYGIICKTLETLDSLTARDLFAGIKLLIKTTNWKTPGGTFEFTAPGDVPESIEKMMAAGSFDFEGGFIMSPYESNKPITIEDLWNTAGQQGEIPTEIGSHHFNLNVIPEEALPLFIICGKDTAQIKSMSLEFEVVIEERESVLTNVRRYAAEGETNKQYLIEHEIELSGSVFRSRMIVGKN